MGPSDVPPGYIQYVEQLESGGRDSAHNRGSSAVGRFQFVKGTWERLRRDHPELLLTSGGRTDRAQSTRAFLFYTAQNGTYLQGRLGRPPTNSELWLAHFLGPVGAGRILTAGDRAPLTAAMNPGTVRSNRFLTSLHTVGNLRAWVRSRVPDDLPGRAFVVDSVKPNNRGRRTAADLNEIELNRIKGS